MPTRCPRPRPSIPGSAAVSVAAAPTTLTRRIRSQASQSKCRAEPSSPRPALPGPRPGGRLTPGPSAVPPVHPRPPPARPGGPGRRAHPPGARVPPAAAPAASSPAVPAAPPPRPRHPIGVPHFRNLWIGLTISTLGDQFYLVALPWLVLQLTGSSLALGTVLMTAPVPRAALMLGGGAGIDRFSARRVVMATASRRALLVGSGAALVWLGVI